MGDRVALVRLELLSANGQHVSANFYGVRPTTPATAP